MPLPFLKLPLGDGSDSPIKKAIVGPCPHDDLSRAAVASMFLKHYLGDEKVASHTPDVRSSKVPYRDW